MVCMHDLLLRLKNEEDDIEKATEKMQELKGKKQEKVEEEEIVATAAPTAIAATEAVLATDVKKVVFSCDAGMGSSAMGAASLRKKFKSAGLEHITVINTAINDIPLDADIVITHRQIPRLVPSSGMCVITWPMRSCTNLLVKR